MQGADLKPTQSWGLTATRSVNTQMPHRHRSKKRMRFETTELQGLQLYCSNKEIKDLETRFLIDKAGRVTCPHSHTCPVATPVTRYCARGGGTEPDIPKPTPRGLWLIESCCAFGLLGKCRRLRPLCFHICY